LEKSAGLLPQAPWQERQEHYHKGGQETAEQDTGGNHIFIASGRAYYNL